MTLNDAEAADLVRLARFVLVYLAGEEVDRGRLGRTLESRVNVTVYVRRQLRASMAGHGATLEQAVRDGAAAALTDARFGPPLSRDDLAEARVELWVQTASRAVTLAQVVSDIDLGFHGVELRRDRHSAYYKPSVALTAGVTRHGPLLDKLAVKAGLPWADWWDPRTTLRRTEWEHYCELPDDADRVLHLRRLRLADLEELSTGTLRERARLAADRLLAVQSSDGYFLYEVHPFTGRQSPGPGNLVRQAGCAYALARAADAADQPGRRDLLVSSAGRVIDALLARVVDHGGLRFVAEPAAAGEAPRGKLGSMALSLAAMQRPALALRYGAERQWLLDAVLTWQRDDGSFRCRSGATSAGDDGTSQDYFPGQTLLALAVEAATGSDRARSAMVAALPWYRARFTTWPTNAFVAWQIQAWAVYARSSREVDGAGAQFVFAMADWLLARQVRATTDHPDVIGGYGRGPGRPNMSTAIYTEAIIYAFSLARRMGEVDRARRYREAARLGVDFMRRLQIMPDTAILFRDPTRVVGATPASLSDMTIRCDYDQHALTMYLVAVNTDGLLDI